MSAIPKHIVERDKKGVEMLTFYGIPTTELERDELLAMVNVLAVSLKNEREQALGYIRMLRMATAA